MSCFRFIALATALVGVAHSAPGAPLPKGVDPGAQATDRFGDPLPPFAIDRLGTLRWRQPLRDGRGFSGVAMARGGKHVVSVGDMNFIVWNVPQGLPVPWSLSVKGVTAARFSADGLTIVTVEDEVSRESPPRPGGNRSAITRVRFRDIETGRVMRATQFERPRPLIRRSSDFLDLERHLLVGAGGHLSAWDIDKGTVLWQAQEKADSATLYELAADATKIASVCPNGDIDILELSSGKRLQRIVYSSNEPYFVHPKFSADGQHLLVGGLSSKVSIVDIATEKLVGETDRTKVPVAVSPNGKTMVCLADDRLVLYDALSLKEIRSFEKTTSRQLSAAFSPDGSRIVTGEDFTVGLWDTATGKRLNTVPGHDMALRSIVFAPDGTRIATGGEDERAVLWQIDGAQMLQRWPGHAPAANALAFRGDGRVLAVGEGNSGHGNHMTEVRLWDTEEGHLLRSFPAHLNAVEAIAFAGDGKTLYTAGSDVRIRVWDPATGIRLDQVRFAAHFGVRPGQRALVAVGGVPHAMTGRTLDSWNAGALTRIGPLQMAKSEMLHGIAFALDGKIAVGLCANRERNQADPFAQRLAFRTWDTSTGKELRSFPLPPTDVFAPQSKWALSPDGAFAALAEGPRLRLFDLTAERELVQLQGHNGIQAIAFSPDGKRLATGNHDTTALVWDIKAARIVGLWSRLGDDDSAARAMAARLDGAVPFLIDRVRNATDIERVFARWIGDLGSDDPALVERAQQRLASDATAEFALRLAASTHPNAAGRERAAKILSTLTAAKLEDVERLAATLADREKSVRYADLKPLGPAAEATFKAARARVTGRLTRPVTDPFTDPAYLTEQLLPGAVLRAVSLLASSAAPEADRFLQELARGPEGSRLAQEARTALAQRKK